VGSQNLWALFPHGPVVLFHTHTLEIKFKAPLCPFMGGRSEVEGAPKIDEFDPLQVCPIMGGQGSRSQPGEKLRLLSCEFFG
jgi:hypothetical protein